jgi:hypothetical protein
MGRQAHAFLAARGHDVGIAKLRCAGHPCATARRPEPQTWLMPQAARFDGKACVHMCLAGRVLALAGASEPGPGWSPTPRICRRPRARPAPPAPSRPDHAAGVLAKAPVEAADGRACGRCDDDIGHGGLLSRGSGAPHFTGRSRARLDIYRKADLLGGRLGGNAGVTATDTASRRALRGDALFRQFPGASGGCAEVDSLAGNRCRPRSANRPRPRSRRFRPRSACRNAADRDQRLGQDLVVGVTTATPRTN